MVNLLSLSPGRNLETSMVRVSRKKRPSHKFVLINLTPPTPNINVEVGVALKRVTIKNDHLC